METLTIDGKKYNIQDGEQAYPTSATFPGSWHDAKEGEEYEAQWALNAIDEDDEECRIIYHFTVTKGEEPEADCLDWDNHNNIVKVDY